MKNVALLISSMRDFKGWRECYAICQMKTTLARKILWENLFVTLHYIAPLYTTKIFGKINIDEKFVAKYSFKLKIRFFLSRSIHTFQEFRLKTKYLNEILISSSYHWVHTVFTKSFTKNDKNSNFCSIYAPMEVFLTCKK